LLLHNHYECNHILGNKNSLFFSVSAYCRYLNINPDTLIPTTFYLDAENEGSLRACEAAFGQDADGIWIVKPAENSNRGRKIFITTVLEDIRAKLASEKKLIVQRYMKNLMLYEGRKFDIRVYLLAVTISGRTKFYFYEEGYLRTASYPFSINNLNDRFVHLTNDAIQQQA
jgi:hypothetical protein